MRTSLPASCAAFVLMFFLLVSGAPAGAHAQLEQSTPADGSTVNESPPQVTIKFSEAVTAGLGGVRVFNTEGDRVDAGNSRATTDTVEVDLERDLPDGSYIVTWRVISADSHPVHGGFLFSVRAESNVDAGLFDSLLDTSGDRVWEIAGAVLRFVGYAGLLFAAGTSVMLGLIGQRADRQRMASPIAIAAAAGAAALLLLLPVQATLATGLGAAALFKSGVLSQLLGAGVGTGLLAGLLGAAVLGLSARRSGEWLLVLAGAALAAGSFALNGHTRVDEPVWLATLVDMAHLYAGALWFGGLIVLLVVLLRHRGADDANGAAAAVAHFSGIATIALGAIAASGLTLGWFQVRALRALTSTTYGRLLLVKVSVVALIALLGAFNHYRLVPIIASLKGNDRRWSALRRMVATEAAAIVLVFGLTGVLVNVTPAKTAAGIDTVGSFSAPLGAGTINLTIDPNQAGTNTVHIYLLDDVGRQVDSAASLQLEFSEAAKDIGPIEGQPVKAGPGHWQYDGDALSLAGQWQIEVLARLSKFDEARASVTVRVNR